MLSESHLDEITDITNFPDVSLLCPFSASVRISMNIYVFSNCSRKKTCTSCNANAASVLKDLTRIYLNNKYNHTNCVLPVISYFILITQTGRIYDLTHSGGVVYICVSELCQHWFG